MGILDRFRRGKQPPPDALPKPTQPEHTPSEPSGKEIVNDPVQAARFIHKVCIQTSSFEDHLKGVPSVEQCQLFGLNPEHRHSAANEFTVLTAFAACLFIRKNFDEAYYLAFVKELVPLVETHLARSAPVSPHDDIAAAIEMYFSEMRSDNPTGFACSYLTRAYPEAWDAHALLLQGPAYRAADWVFGYYKIILDMFCRLDTGLSFETLHALGEVIEKAEQESRKNSPADDAPVTKSS